MPFPHQGSRPFTRRGIEVLRRGQHGVYGIFNSMACVYIGRGNLRQQLLAHLGGARGTLYLLKEQPTHYVIEVASNGVTRQRQLIAEFDPVCNRKSKTRLKKP